MKKIIFILLVLFSLKIYSQTPTWVRVLEDTESVTSSAPYTETELINLFLPSKTENLIGTQINITTSFNVILDFQNLNTLMEVLFVNPFYKYQSNTLLNLNQGPKLFQEPHKLNYTIGHTNGSNYLEIPFIHIIEWQDPNTKIKKGATINIIVKHFYSNPFLLPEVQVESTNKIPLQKGVVHFVRLGPGDYRTNETTFYIEDGKVINPNALSAGHYEVKLTQPEECSGILNENLVILPDDVGNSEKFKFIKLCEKRYDIIVTYTAPSFAKAKLLWANATIRFPEKGKPVQKFNMMAYRNSGAMGEPTGTDGKPLKIPYATVIPGIGLQTLYGWPENESAIPEVIFVASLGGYKTFDRFRIDLEEEALNSCNISQDNNGPIYLDLNFDLVGRYPLSVDPEGLWQQVDVGCREDKVLKITRGNSANGYPTSFKRIKFTDADIEKFRKSEEFEKTLSNGGATLKIEFKIAKNE